MSLLWVVLGASVGRADEPADGPPPEARKAFSDGKAAFERGEYEAALNLFQRAVLIAPAPSLYYNIGMAYERLGRYEDSALAFEKYLELADAPQSDEEKTFQTNLRSRAAANRIRAKRAPNDPANTPPTPLVEPPPAPPPMQQRPAYVPQPYAPYAPYAPAAPYVFTAPPVTHQMKLERARMHRNNGIALTVIGSVFTLTGIGLTTWVAKTIKNDTGSGFTFGLAMWGSTAPIIIGVPFLIPGAVAWGKWQAELSRERKRPDDGAAARKAALDLAAPPVAASSSAGSSPFLVSTPAFQF